MSDPAKSPEEIEDVLASIRRLVSDHGNGSTGGTGPAAQSIRPAVAKPPAQSTAQAPAQPEPAAALVLAPSFRVTDPDDPWVPVTDATDADPEDEEDDMTSALVSDVVAADDDMALDGKSDEGSADMTDDLATADLAPEPVSDWQPDDRLAHFDVVGGDEATDADAAAMPLAPDGTDADAADLADLDSDDTTHEGGHDEAAFDPDDEDDYEPDAAGSEAETSEEDLADLLRLDGALSQDDATAEFESDTGDENWPGEGAESALLSLVARRDPVAEPEVTDPDEDPMPEHEEHAGFDVADTDAAMDPADADDAAVAEPEAHEEAVTEDTADPDVAEPTAMDDLTDDDADAGLAPPIFSRRGQGDARFDVHHGAGEASIDAEAGAEDEAEDLGADPSPFSFPDPEDGILDEDTLREIIVDVVREELQGVLGQRITRNVRKMVRREIRLALAAEDLE